MMIFAIQCDTVTKHVPRIVGFSTVGVHPIARRLSADSSPPAMLDCASMRSFDALDWL